MRNVVNSPDHSLLRTIDRLAHLLPAQGPISIFIHHNTLHAFEHLAFEEAVEHAAMRLERELWGAPFGSQPLTPEAEDFVQQLAASVRRIEQPIEIRAEGFHLLAAQPVQGCGLRP